MVTFTVKCLFSVGSLKWLHMNMGMKYSRWDHIWECWLGAEEVF